MIVMYLKFIVYSIVDGLIGDISNFCVTKCKIN